MTMSPHRPHLPLELIQKVTQDPALTRDSPSLVFSDRFHAMRLKVIDESTRDSANQIFEIRRVDGGPPAEASSRPDRKILKGHIHMAAEGDVDPLVVFEILRLGCNVDLKTGNGKTAFDIAFNNICVRRRGLLPPSESLYARTELIARTLLEQHADVNHAVEGITALHLACGFGVVLWDWIELLLKHGAKPELDVPANAAHRIPPPIDLILSSRDKRRFRDLVRANPPGQERPPQKCPCWSGKLLKDCHAAGQLPYPVDFYCTCGSKKTYRKCCAQREEVVEEWDPEYRYIFQAGLKVPPIFPRGPVGPNGEFEISKEIMMASRCCQPRRYGGPDSMPEKDAWMFIHSIIFRLEPRRVIDPAFEFAMKEVLFLPRPHGRSKSKMASLATQREWNASVDRYIASGAAGSRSQDDIEHAAKIGRTGGALYRVCEGLNCTKVEGRDIKALSQCGKCKIASTWKTHKKVCGQGEQREQALPSQAAIDEFLIKEGMSVILHADGTLSSHDDNLFY
ncbi:hypothetical protein DXG01_002991 [Tephrocybe rancida]|nr:hypothetical protein DXG01_002991 [Tephrocybe rancida]